MSDHTIGNPRPHDLLDLWIAKAEQLDRSPYRIRNYNAAIGRFLQTSTTHDDITRWDDGTLVLWLQKLKKDGLSASARQWHQRHLYPFLRWLHKRRTLPTDITQMVPLTEVAEVKRCCLEPRTYVRTIATQGAQPKRKSGEIAKTPHRLRGLAMLHILHDTGIRRPELVALNYEYVDQKNREIHLRVTKTKKIRTVYYTKETKMALAEYFASERGSQPGPLFCKSNGERMSIDAVVSWLRRLGERAGVDVAFHDFRRGLAVDSIAKGMAASDLQTILGHQTIVMSLMYAEAGRETAARESYRRLIG